MMKQIEKMLLAGTMFAGAVSLGAGGLAAAPRTPLASEVATGGPVLLAQADTRERKREDSKADDAREKPRPGAKAGDHAGARKDAAKDNQVDKSGKRADAARTKPADGPQAEKPRRDAAEAHPDATKAKPVEKPAKSGAAAAPDHAPAAKTGAAEERQRAGAGPQPARRPAATDRDDRAATGDRRQERDRAADRDQKRAGAADRPGAADRRPDHGGSADDRGSARDQDRNRDRGSSADDRGSARDQDRDRGNAGERQTRLRDRTIIHVDGRTIVRHDDGDRLRRNARDVKVVTGAGGTRTTTVVRPDGTRITTVEDSRGRLVRRSRWANGRDVVLFVNEHPDVAVVPLINLPPLRLAIPRERYIVEADRAAEPTIVETLSAPPVEAVERRYDLNEVLQSERLREKLRRIDLSAITFATGSADIPPDQVNALKATGQALKGLIHRNPDSVFLIGGHTDAVGSAEDNLALSDERAESVAAVLTSSFGVPAANLVTQGYGEQFLKVPTDGPEQANRRVTIRNITPLLRQQAQR
jgi:outer membrane protein OmpA-like peptidoglycan-associated protein